MTVTCKQPLRALRDEQDTTEKPAKGRVTPEKRPAPDGDGYGAALVCRFCRTRITRHDLGMEVEGSHRHIFFNPQGEVFEIGCFASAKNLLPTGPKTDEFTWFPGFEWQAVACTGCIAQLGWRYTGRKSGFFGLILTALTEEFTGKP